MIGVIAGPTDYDVATEFFELFKTPWEFYRGEQKYDVLLCTSEARLDNKSAKLVLIYGGEKRDCDIEDQIHVASQERATRDLAYKGARIPIYEGCITFYGEAATALCDRESRLPAICLRRSGEGTVARIGYNLFAEVRALLTTGQPVMNANVPVLDLHIALLRDLIVASGVYLVEIPPIPAGYKFIACLTHDVDHPFIRNHRFDHTMVGFLYRATLGSVIDLFRGRRSVRNVLSNVVAASSVPLVHLGLAKDVWSEFDRYARLEKGLRSSFFVIPFKDWAGRSGQGRAPSRRAARYGAVDIAVQIRKLVSIGCEIGAHGIDAWLDSSVARMELEEVRGIAGVQEIGVRMHWLYFNEQSPMVLEMAGADYDSTVGYNETVGYRAGTTQVYRPLGVTRLLELPLHIMDTALFYPTHLDLSPKDAMKRVGEIIDNAVKLGGCVTVNWHDRSIAPERCWGDFYVDLLHELKTKGAWFGTAAETVSWFRKRRSATFEETGSESDLPHIKKAAVVDERLPDLCLRVLNVRQSQTLSRN